jgi:hypothetical protein
MKGVVDMKPELVLFEKLSGIFYDAKRKEEENCSYNVFSILNMERKEVSTHSKVICSLLDKNGEHKMGDEYLKLFIKSIGFEEWLHADSDWDCIPEYYSGVIKGSKPDFVIKSDRYCILIEMKIDAGDADRQLVRYAELLKKDPEFSDIEKHQICYLTLDGKEPSEQSAEDLDVELLSFKEHISNWLDSCIEISDKDKSVCSILLQYQVLIRKLVNTDSGLNEMIDL